MQLSQQVVVKYPLRIRVAACLFCALTAPLFVKSSVLIAIIVESVALCAAIWVLWYRVGISGAEISIRYFPFIAKHIPTQEVSEVIQQRALVLVTRKCRISLWGLPTSTGEAIIRLLPNRLQSNEDAEQSGVSRNMLGHRRWATCLGIAFVVSTASVVPFLYGNPLHEYWNSIGRYVLGATMCLFLAFIFEAGMAYISWSYFRSVDRINRRSSKRNGNAGQR